MAKKSIKNRETKRISAYVQHRLELVCTNETFDFAL